MPMTAFVQRFGKLAADETRTVTLMDGKEGEIPDGEYSFLELYCDEPDCDCRRVTIQVATPNPFRIWATFSFGWEPVAYYKKWSPGNPFAKEMSGLTIEPMGVQSPFTKDFFELFARVLQDKNYVARLARHYAMFKETVEPTTTGAPRSAMTPRERALSRKKNRR